MGLKHSKKKSKTANSHRPGVNPDSLSSPAATPPRRSMDRKNSATIRSGRTIAAKREQLETANERAAARKKVQKKKTRRLLIVSVIFIVVTGLVAWLLFAFFIQSEEGITTPKTSVKTAIEPSSNVKIIDEDAQATGGKITARMKEYIALVESDFADLGYIVEKAVLPVNSIREVDFYLQGRPGYIKTVIDRDAAVSVEDADRTIRYLAGQGITSYQYIDVRVKGRAFYLP